MQAFINFGAYKQTIMLCVDATNANVAIQFRGRWTRLGLDSLKSSVSPYPQIPQKDEGRLQRGGIILTVLSKKSCSMCCTVLFNVLFFLCLNCKHLVTFVFITSFQTYVHFYSFLWKFLLIKYYSNPYSHTANKQQLKMLIIISVCFKDLCAFHGYIVT